MKKFKHVKYKNTGIIFELLSKQVASDVLTNTKNHSLSIVKKYFKEGTALKQELSCYQALIDSKNKKESSARKLIDLVMEQRRRIDAKKLNREKYNLISEIKSKYDFNQFFEVRLDNYKLKASIYKLFEYNSSDNPIGHVNSYDTLLEHVIGKSKSITDKPTSLYENQTAEIQKLAFKFIVEKFNDKYKDLNHKQKILINKYITENTSLSPFKEFVYAEALTIQKELFSIIRKTEDVALRIKLNEANNLLNTVLQSKRIKDEHISSLIKYHELVDLLKVTKNAK